MDLSDVGPFFGGTVSGAIVVLGLVGRWRRKPSLSLELDPNLAGTGPTLKKVANKDCAYVRLLVHNGGGKDLATGVYVEIEDVESAGIEPRPDVFSLRGMWLAWADRELTNPRADKTKESVAPGSSMPVDLVHLNANVPGLMILDVRPQPVGSVKPNYMGSSSYHSSSLSILIVGQSATG